MKRQRYSSKEEKLRNYLKAARKARKLSQLELAEMHGTTQSFVSKYELGERFLTFLEVVNLCKTLQIDLQDLLQTLEEE